MTLPDLAVIIVAYRSGEDLTRCVDSALALGGVTTSVAVVNNEPEDDGPARLARETGILCLESGANVGFCTAVNSALAATASRYVLLLNPDALVAPDYAARLIDRMDRDPVVGSAGGRILRGTPGEARHVDSVGLTMLPGRRPEDMLHGSPDDGVRNGAPEVFGVTAAAAVYRRSALDEVAVDGAVLPDEFFMYLDDVDLAWRLRLRGYRSIVDHAAVAWHLRALAGDDNEQPGGLAGKIAEMRREAARPDYVRERCWVNQLLMIVRNDEPALFLRQVVRMAWIRSRGEVFHLVQRPGMAIRARQRFAGLLPGALAQRRVIRSGRRVDADEMARWLP